MSYRPLRDTGNFTNVPELPEPRGITKVAGLDLNFLATSADLVRLQKSANEAAKSREFRSDWRGMTVRSALRDAGDALFGLASDLYGNTTDSKLPLRELMTRDDRLRGIGVLLVLVSGVWMLVDSVL